MTIKEIFAKLKSGETLTAEEEAVIEAADEDGNEDKVTKAIEKLVASIEAKKVEEIVEVKKIEKKDFNSLTKEEKRAEFWKSVVNKTAYNNATTAADGQVLIPTELHSELIDRTAEVSRIRPECYVESGIKGNYDIAYLSAGATANWQGAEGTAKVAKKVAFGKQTLTPYTIYAIAVFSKKLRDNAAFDIATTMEGALAEAIAEKEDVAFVAGTGLYQPTGIETYYSSMTGKNKITAAQKGALADRIVAAQLRLEDKFSAGAKWFMSSSQLEVVNELKDTTNRPLLFTGVDGTKTIGSKPVVVHDSFTNIWYGNAKKGYVIGDGVEMNVTMTDTGLVTLDDESTFNCFTQNGFAIRYEKDTDGEMFNPNAFIAIEAGSSSSS